MILIDNREKSRVPELLEKIGIKTKRLTLDIGDYLIQGSALSVCISLKSVGDYLSSINSQHLSDELYQMSSCYNRSILIIFGNLDEAILYRKIRRETHFNYIGGAVVHISDAGEKGAVSVLNFTTDYDVVNFLKTVHNLISTDDIYREPSVKKIKVTEETRTLLNISRLPGVGSKRAEALLKHFKSIRNIYNATQEQLEEVEGVGKGIAKNIYEFINKEHEEGKCYQTSIDQSLMQK